MQQPLQQTPGMPPDASNRLSHCGPPHQGPENIPNSLGSYGNMPGNTSASQGNMQNPTNMPQSGMYSAQNPSMPGRPSSTSSASGVPWNGIPTPNNGSLPSSSQSDMMQNQQNCGSMPNLNQTSVDQSIDLLADIMGNSSSTQNKPSIQNTNSNNANGGAFGAIMSEQLSSSMPGGLNNIDNNGVYNNPSTSNGGYGSGPPGGVQRQMSVPGATALLDSGRHASLPNVADPPRKLNFAFLAHLVMSLCNHVLSVVCHCCQHRHLCTALPVTGLIIEASYLTNICSYAPSICTLNIKSM